MLHQARADPDSRPWAELLSDGKFSETSLNEDPSGFMVDVPYLQILAKAPEGEMTWLHHLHLAIGMKQQGGGEEEFVRHLNASVRMRKNNTIALLLLNRTDEAWAVALAALQTGGEDQRLRKEGEGVSVASLVRDVGAKLLGKYCDAKNWPKVKEAFEAVEKLPKTVSSRWELAVVYSVETRLHADWRYVLAC
jgi:hypothetical protein